MKNDFFLHITILCLFYIILIGISWAITPAPGMEDTLLPVFIIGIISFIIWLILNKTKLVATVLNLNGIKLYF